MARSKPENDSPRTKRPELTYDSREIAYFGLIILMPDKLHAVNVNRSIAEIILSSLNRHDLTQGGGYHDESTFKFQLLGTPFRVGGLEGSEASDNVRSFFCDLFGNLFSQGWESVTSSDLTQHISNSTIIFKRRRSRPETEGETKRFLCISPSAQDRLALVNLPKELAKGLVEKIAKLWEIQEQRSTQKNSLIVNYRLKLVGIPWTRCTGIDAIRLRFLLLNIIRYLRQHKYKLKINVNLKGTADAMFFQYDSHQQLGADDIEFVLYLAKNDRIRLLGSPDYINHIIREEISESWEQGLQEERRRKGAYEFKLKGNPWWTSGTETMESRFLISNIISRLRTRGWEVNGVLDITRMINDKSVFIFRQCAPADLPWLCLSFHESDKIRYMSDQGIDLRNIIERHLHSTTIGRELIQRSRDFGFSFEWKIKGTPFSGLSGFGARDDQIIILRLLLNILRDLDQHGWTLIASADISAKYINHNPTDLHSWFFHRESDLNLPAVSGRDYTGLSAWHPSSPSREHKSSITNWPY